MRNNLLKRIVSILVVLCLFTEMIPQAFAGNKYDEPVPGGVEYYEKGDLDGTYYPTAKLMSTKDEEAYIPTEVTVSPGGPTNVWAQPSLEWTFPSKIDPPTPGLSDYFQVLWLYSDSDELTVPNIYDFTPVSYPAEYWSSALAAYKEEKGDNFDITEVYEHLTEWTTDTELPNYSDDVLTGIVQLPKILDDGKTGGKGGKEDPIILIPSYSNHTYACLVRYYDSEKEDFLYGVSENFVKIINDPEAIIDPTDPEIPVLEEPGRFNDKYYTNDSVNASPVQEFFYCNPRYGEAQITYQWYRSDTNDYNGTIISGANSEYYYYPRPTELGEVSYYYCIYSFMNYENEVEYHYSDIGKVESTAASAFSAAIFGGDITVEKKFPADEFGRKGDADLFTFGKYCKDASGTYSFYQSAEHESCLTPSLGNLGDQKKLNNSDYMTLQWYVSETADFETGEKFGEELRFEKLDVEKDTLNEFYMQVANPVMFSNDTVGECYVTALFTNYYTLEGTDYTYAVPVTAKLITVEKNEELYSLHDDGTGEKITGYNGHENVMYIPASIGGVAAEGIDTFVINKRNVQKIVFSEGFTKIDYALCYFKFGLREVVLPESITEIEGAAFEYSGLEKINFPSKLAKIGDGAFIKCGITDVSFGDSIFPETGDYVFSNCASLKTVKMPKSASGELTGTGVFYNCSKLYKVDNDESILNPDYDDDFYGTLYKSFKETGVLNSDGDFTYTLKSAGEDKYYEAKYTGDPCEVMTVPESFMDIEVRVLKSGLSYDVREALKKVVLPATITTIGDEVFKDCKNLEEVNFEDLTNLESVGQKAFYNCHSLKSPVVLNRNTVVQWAAFMNCFGITGLKANYAWLGSNSFDNCVSLEEFDGAFRPFNGKINYNGVADYQNFMFCPCYELNYEKRNYLISVNNEDYVLTDNGFSGMNIVKAGKYFLTGTADAASIIFYADVHENVLNFPSELVADNGQTYTIKKVDYKGFEISLASDFEISIAEGIEEIAFDKTGEIAKLTLPHSLKKIVSLSGSKLRELALYENIETIEKLDGNYLVTLDLTGATGLKKIDKNCFENSTRLKEVLLPENCEIEVIGDRAFYGCTSLKNFDFTKLTKIQSIGYTAFNNCAITVVDLSNATALDAVTNRAFLGCNDISVIKLPEGLITVGEYAFKKIINSNDLDKAGYVPKKVTELVLPSTLNSIGTRAFENCFYADSKEAATVITFPENLLSIESGAFYGERDHERADGTVFTNNYVLASSEMPSGLRWFATTDAATSVAYAVFGNGHVTELVFGDSLEEIGRYAFLHDNAINSVTLGSKISKIHESAFEDAENLAVINNLDAATSLTEIGKNAFNHVRFSGMESVVLPEGLEKIGDFAFEYCGSKMICIPSTVKSIGNAALSTDLTTDSEINVTFYSKSGTIPELHKNTFGGEPRDGLTVNIYCNYLSAPYVWATVQNEKFTTNKYNIVLLENDAVLSARFMMRDGSQAPTEAFKSVKWYDAEGKLCGSDTTLKRFTMGAEYTVEAELSDEYAWDYRLDNYSAVLTGSTEGAEKIFYLIPRDRINITGRIDQGDNNKTVTATLTMTSDAGNVRTKTVLISAGQKSFNISDLPMCDMNMVFTVENRSDVRLYSIQLAADYDGKVDLGTIEMLAREPRLNYSVAYSENGERLDEVLSYDLIECTVKNETTGQVIDGAGVVLDTLTIPEGVISRGDRISVSGKPIKNSIYDSKYYSFSAEFTAVPADEEAPEIVFELKGKERVDYNLSSRYDQFYIALYDEEGRLYTNNIAFKDKDGTLPVEAGSYTLICVEPNNQIGILPSLKRYEEIEYNSIFKKEITVPENGAVYIEGTVPEWERIELDSNADMYVQISVNDMFPLPDKKLVMLTFEFPDRVASLEKKITLYTSLGCSFDNDTGIVAEDYQLKYSTKFETMYDYLADDRVANKYVITTKENKGVLYFYICNRTENDLNVELTGGAEISDGYVVSRLSGSMITIPYINISELPSTTSRKSGLITITDANTKCKTAELYVNSELQDTTEFSTNSITHGQAELEYNFDKGTGYYRVKVVVKDENGDIVCSQDEYKVYYIEYTGEMPLAKELYIHMYNSVAPDLYREDEMTYNFLEKGNYTDFIYFVVDAFPGSNADLQDNYTFLTDVIYTFSLSFADPSLVDPDDVWLATYRTDDSLIEIVKLTYNPDNQKFEGELVYKPGTANYTDRVCGFKPIYAGLAERDTDPVIRFDDEDEGEKTEYLSYAEARERQREGLEVYRPVTDAEINRRFDDFYDKFGVELPDEIKTDIRRYYFELNDSTGFMYDAYQLAGDYLDATKELEEVVEIIRSFYTERIPAGVSPGTLLSEGFKRFAVSGSDQCVFIKQTEISRAAVTGSDAGEVYCFMDIYDFYHYMHYTITIDSSSSLMTPQTVIELATSPSAVPEDEDEDSMFIMLLDYLSELWENLYLTYITMGEGLVDTITSPLPDKFEFEEKMERAQVRLEAAQKAFKKSKEAWVEKVKAIREELKELNPDITESEIMREIEKCYDGTRYAEELERLQEDYKMIVKAQQELKEAEKAIQGVVYETACRKYKLDEKIAKIAKKHPTLARLEKKIVANSYNLINKVATPARVSKFLKVGRVTMLIGRHAVAVLAVVDMALSIYDLYDNMSAFDLEIMEYDTEYEVAYAQYQDFCNELYFIDFISSGEKNRRYEACTDAFYELTDDLKKKKKIVATMCSFAVSDDIAAVASDIACIIKQDVAGLVADTTSIFAKLGLVFDNYMLTEVIKDISADWDDFNVKCRLPKNSRVKYRNYKFHNRRKWDKSLGGSSSRINTPFCIDPSGIVYEAVLSNAVEGATATIYYKDGEQEVKWNAEEYLQMNPLITDVYGKYSWMTPEGLWKVKVTKEGYYDANSENDPEATDGWLPVLPPQLNVNIPMVSKAAPFVESVSGDGKDVYIVFSQYMDIEALTSDPSLIGLAVSGKETEFNFTFTDAEESPTKPGVYYGRVMKLSRADGTDVNEKFSVNIKKDFVNYAGTKFASDYASGEIEPGKVLGSINVTVTDYYETAAGTDSKLVVKVFDTRGEALDGVKVNARTVYEGNLRIDAFAVSDAEGNAVFNVHGNSIGFNTLMFTAGTAHKLNIAARIRPYGYDTEGPGLTGLELIEKEIYITPGEEYELSVIYEPSDTKETLISWTSSDPVRAVVDEYNKVHGLKVGTTVLTGVSENGKFTVNCTVHVEFKDVRTDSAEGGTRPYYYEAVYWLADTGVTKGYTNEETGLYDMFGPERTCTREEMITFLWRLVGSPDPESMASKFSDVQKTNGKYPYYYKAVMWATEQGITKGYSEGEYAGKFGVGVECRREHALTFLWRAAGKPAPKTSTNKFTDVTPADYYYKACLWASEKKISNGYRNDDGTRYFGPELNCLREHIAFFMYKYKK